MNDVSCVDHLSSVKKCHKCPNCCSRSTCRGQITPVLGKMASPGSQSKSCNSPQGRLLSPLPVLAKFDKITIISCYANPHTNLYLEALHQLMNKNAVEPVTTPTSLRFYKTFSGSQTKQPVELDPSTLNKFLKTESFKMETPETIRTSLQAGEWVAP